MHDCRWPKQAWNKKLMRAKSSHLVRYNEMVEGMGSRISIGVLKSCYEICDNRRHIIRGTKDEVVRC